MEKFSFTKGVEKLVDPISVGSIHFMQFFNDLIPTFLQKKLVENSSKKTSSMGFIIDPYAYFLCYELTNINNEKEKRELIFNCDIKKGVMKNLDQKVWLEGNLSIGYGKKFVGDDKYIFSLKFDPNEVKEALDIPLSSLDLKKNTWYSNLYDKKPIKLVCFPYAQHFISDSPGTSSNLKNKKELINAFKNTDFSKIKVIDVKIFKYMFLFGSLLSLLITIILIVLLILK